MHHGIDIKSVLGPANAPRPDLEHAIGPNYKLFAIHLYLQLALGKRAQPNPVSFRGPSVRSAGLDEEYVESNVARDCNSRIDREVGV